MGLRHFFWSSVILTAFLLLGLWYWWEVHGVLKLKTKIEQVASEQVQGSVKIKTLTAPVAWPFKVQLIGLHVESKKYHLQANVDRVIGTLDLKSFSFKTKKVFPDIDVKVRKAQIKIHHSIPTSHPPSAPNTPSALPQNLTDLKTQIPRLQDLAFHLNISDSQIEFTKPNEEPLLLHGWNTKIDLENLSQPLKISQNFSTLLKLGQLSLSLPVQIEGQTELKNGRLDLLGFRAKVINIESLLSGYVNVNNNSFLIQAKTQAPDLAKIPISLPDFPLQSWKGSLTFEVRVAQENPGAPLNSSGSFHLKDFESQLKYLIEKEGIEADGPIKASASGQFQFVNRTPAYFSFPQLQWNLDLSSAKIKYKDLFYKHADVALTSDGDLGWSQQAQIKKANLKFYALTAGLSGNLDAQKHSNLVLDFNIPSMRGFESFFPFLSSSPLGGSLRGQAQLTGLLTDPQNLRIDLKKFELGHGQGKISYKSEKIQIEGPFQIDLKASGVLNKMQIEQSHIDLRAQLDGLLLQSKEFFQQLKLRRYQAQLAIKGKMNFQNLMESPLVITGTQELHAPLATLASTTKTEKPATPSPIPSEAPKAFMNDSVLLQGMDVTSKLDLQEFHFNDLTAKGIQTQVRIKNKALSVVGEIQSVFDGKVKINSAFIPLTAPNPLITYNLSVANLQAEPALIWISPKTKDLLKGRMTLEAQGQTFLPSSPSFLSRLVAEGKFQMNDAVLNTLPFEKMAKEALAKIPGVGQPKNSAGPLKTNLQVPFSLANSSLEIKNLVATTPRKEELRLNGKVDLEMNANLTGQVALVDAPVSGSFFEANSDALKRLVVPIRVSGNLMKPQLSFAEETVKLMLQKTLDYEKGKLRKTVDAEISKAKKQAEDQLKKEADKKAQELKEKVNQGLQKGIQDLLGR